MISRIFFQLIFLLFACQCVYATPFAEQLKKLGYVEIRTNHAPAKFNSLYAYFDGLIEFLQANPVWAQKLYKANFLRLKAFNHL